MGLFSKSSENLILQIIKQLGAQAAVGLFLPRLKATQLTSCTCAHLMKFGYAQYFAILLQMSIYCLQR